MIVSKSNNIIYGIIRIIKIAINCVPLYPWWLRNTLLLRSILELLNVAIKNKIKYPMHELNNNAVKKRWMPYSILAIIGRKIKKTKNPRDTYIMCFALKYLMTSNFDEKIKSK